MTEGNDGQRRKWAPNKERKVRSKKSFDQERVKNITAGPGRIYKGELDPRKKDDEKKNQRFSLEKREDGEECPDFLHTREEVPMGDVRQHFYKNDASPARLAALFVTRSVRLRGAFTQELIQTHIDTSSMSSQDRAFATLLSLGVASTYGMLDDVINRALASPRDVKPDVRDALRISTYEIIVLKKQPHAALDQGVELVRAVAPSAARLGNAVLHRILEMQPEFPFGDPATSLEALARLYAFPEWMARKFVEDLGAAHAADHMRASNESAPLFVSVNSIKACDDEVIAAFADAGATLTPAQAGGYAPSGCYHVSLPRVLTKHQVKKLFAQGKILVSDAAAQSVAELALPECKPGRFLEVGSGRGTKTIMLQSQALKKYGSQMKLTCIDSHAFKGELLASRAKEYGVSIEKIVTGNAMRLKRHVGDEPFDAIFVDAPCSGLGTLRRHHELRWRMRPEHIDELAETQLAMLKSAALCVAQGGQLVYSTCTVTYAENNGVVKAFLESQEGAGFSLAPLAGKACFSSSLGLGFPDAHFAARFVRNT